MFFSAEREQNKGILRDFPNFNEVFLGDGVMQAGTWLSKTFSCLKINGTRSS